MQSLQHMCPQEYYEPALREHFMSEEKWTSKGLFEVRGYSGYLDDQLFFSGSLKFYVFCFGGVGLSSCCFGGSLIN